MDLGRGEEEGAVLVGERFCGDGDVDGVESVSVDCEGGDTDMDVCWALDVSREDKVNPLDKAVVSLTLFATKGLLIDELEDGRWMLCCFTLPLSVSSLLREDFDLLGEGNFFTEVCCGRLLLSLPGEATCLSDVLLPVVVEVLASCAFFFVVELVVGVVMNGFVGRGIKDDFFFASIILPPLLL